MWIGELVNCWIDVTNKILGNTENFCNFSNNIHKYFHLQNILKIVQRSEENVNFCFKLPTHTFLGQNKVNFRFSNLTVIQKGLMQDWESRLSSQLMTNKITAGGKFEKSEFGPLLKMQYVAIEVVQKLHLQDEVGRWFKNVHFFVTIHTIENVNTGG